MDAHQQRTTTTATRKSLLKIIKEKTSINKYFSALNVDVICYSIDSH